MTIDLPLPASSYDVRQIVQQLRYPRKDTLTIAAHRALRWNGIPDNSLSAVLQASRVGLACIEIDIQLSKDGVPVVFHDDGLGRSTNIGELENKPVYSPYTGRGYNPLIRDCSWYNLIRKLHLKEEHGIISGETVVDLGCLLDFIRDARLNLVVLLDTKTKDTIPVCYEALRNRKNANGIPALEWCLWKVDACWYPLPEVLESEHWFRSAIRQGLSPLMMPVLRPETARAYDTIACAKAFSKKSYTVAFEVGLRSPGSILQDVVDFVRSPECPVKGLAFFTPLGDLHPQDGIEIQYDMGDFPIRTTVRHGLRNEWSFSDNFPPRTIDSVLKDGDSVDGRDRRWDIGTSMGYNIVIADHGDVLQRQYKREDHRSEERKVTNAQMTACDHVVDFSYQSGSDLRVR